MDGRDDRVILGYDKSKADYYVTLAMLHGAKEYSVGLMDGGRKSVFTAEHGRPGPDPYFPSRDRGYAAFIYCRIFGLLDEVTNDTP
jgi:hypothetical protein